MTKLETIKKLTCIDSEHRHMIIGGIVASAKILLICEVGCHVVIEDLKSGVLSQVGGLVYTGFMVIVLLNIFNNWVHGKY